MRTLTRTGSAALLSLRMVTLSEPLAESGCPGVTIRYVIYPMNIRTPAIVNYPYSCLNLEHTLI